MKNCKGLMLELGGLLNYAVDLKMVTTQVFINLKYQLLLQVDL